MIRAIITATALLLIAACGTSSTAPAPTTTTPPASSTPITAATINAAAGVTEATVCGAFGAYYAAKGIYQPTGALLVAQEALATFCSASPVVGSTPTQTLVNLALDGAQLIAAHTLGL